MSIEESRLAVLFEGITEAAAARRYPDALRLADSARRFVPDNPTAILIQARLLLEVGDAHAAADSLRGREDTEGLLLYADAALGAGDIASAANAVHTLLQRLAVDSLPELRRIAERLCRIEGGFPGWVGVDSELRLAGEIPGDSVAGIYRGAERVGDIVTESGSAERVGDIVAETGGAALQSFTTEIAAGRAGVLQVRLGERPLLGSGLVWPPDQGAEGWVVLEGDRLHGEVSLNWAPNSALTLLVSGAGEMRRVRVEPQERGRIGWPFSVEVNLDHVPTEITVMVLLPGGRRVPLAGSPIRLPQPMPRPLGRVAAITVPASTARAMPRKVNIVVPVYSGLKETLTCLLSVLRTMPQDAVLTIVHDAGPDLKLREALGKFVGDPRITVLWNPENLGFPGAANRGMRLHPYRDVVLLNADTEVFDGWLERLRAVAYAKENIGAVTPLGESASIVSYPGTRAKPCTSEEAERIDRIARRVNAHRVIEIPVGVGFCLYLRRICLEEIGEFDEQGFDKGYGEEDDLCLRARAHGWRHVAATGVFVRHVGGLSYGRAREVLTTRNQRVINHRYPGYEELIRKFLKTDPLRAAKRALDRGRLLHEASRPVLLLSSELAGGVRRHVEERQAQLAASGHSVVVIRGDADPERPGRVKLQVFGCDFEHLVYDLPRELRELKALLAALKLTHIELHHFLGLPAAVLEMVVRLGVPYRAFVHDYAWICPRVSLLNGNGEYCGEPALAACETCVQTHGSALAETTSVAQLRERSARILMAAERIVAPTDDARKRLARYLPKVPIDVIPWEAAASSPTAPTVPPRARNGARTRVLLLGAINTPKGYDALLACARDAAQRDLPLEFSVIGYTRDDAALRATGRVSITGPYQEHEVPKLLEREDGQVAWFASITPETWSYTLTHVMKHNLPIVAFDVGAIAERLRGAGTGLLLPLRTPAAAINDALLGQANVQRATAPSENRNIAKGQPRKMSTTESTATNDPEISATVQVLTLPIGIYAFTVQSGAASPSDSLTLPALQVSPAPLRGGSVVEFLNGPTTMDRWLTGTGDVLTVRVSGAPATVLLTSLRAPDSAVLAIDIRRLDAPVVRTETPAIAAPAPELPSAPAQVEYTAPRIATRVHLPYLGDLDFEDGWAGRPAENLWIEGFAATPVGPIDPDLIEYCGLNEAGELTDWLSRGELCGSRGAGVPLVAFAVRVKPDAAASYVCHYSGQFLSGNIVGPFSDGRFCRSDAPEDPLVALQLRIEATAN